MVIFTVRLPHTFFWQRCRTDKAVAVIFFAESERKTAEDVVHRMVNRAIGMEGTITGEHGIGLVKRDYLPHEIGQETVDAMRKVSTAPAVEEPCSYRGTDQASLRSTMPLEL